MFLRMKRSRTKERERDTLVAQEISSPYRINELLTLISNKHAMLEARIPGDTNCYTTSLLDLFPNQHRLALDELKPNEGHTNFLASKALKLSCSLDGMLIKFETELKEKGEAEGLSFYRVLFPSSINFLQRRQHPRVTIPGSANFQAHHEGKQHAFNGYVQDLSASGIAVLLDGIHSIKQGEILTDCTAQLPLIGTITFDLEVCHAFLNPTQKMIKAGGTFTKIDSGTKSKLEKLIKHLQNQ